jgi:hypothetical protein
MPNMANASIVDQDIKPTFGSRNPLYHSPDLGLFSYIKLLRACTSASGSNVTGNMFRRIHSDIGENDMRPLLRKEPCDLLSDARSGSRDEGNFLI